jgi:hypothetical protein
MSSLLEGSRFRRQTISTDCQHFRRVYIRASEIYIRCVCLFQIRTYVRCIAFENDHCWKITDDYYC